MPRPRKLAHTLTAAEKERIAQAKRTPPDELIRPVPKCGARNSHRDVNEPLCTKSAGWGTQHPGWGRCRRHGGSSSVGDQHAAKERAIYVRDEFKRTARFYGGTVSLEPEEALLEALHLSVGAVRFISDYIASWNQQATDRTELAQLEAQMDDNDAETLAGKYARIASEGFRRGWVGGAGNRTRDDVLGAPMENASADDDGEPVADWRLYTGETLSDDRTMLPSLIAAYATNKAIAFTDTEYAAWLKIYREERKEMRACAQACINANIQDRIARTMEQRAFLHRAIIGHALDELGVNADPGLLRHILQSATRKAIAELPTGALA